MDFTVRDARGTVVKQFRNRHAAIMLCKEKGLSAYEGARQIFPHEEMRRSERPKETFQWDD